MNPDLEILKSLEPDYILSPNSLESDLQPKYASIGVKSLFLNLKSVDGMYAAIEGLGKKFHREQQAQAMLDEFDAFMANTEDMQQKDPDIILRAAHALPDKVKQMFAEEFSTNDVWKHFRAVQDGRVYDLDSSLFNMSANFSYSEALQALQPMLYGED